LEVKEFKVHKALKELTLLKVLLEHKELKVVKGSKE
jgi:hypothetical protein